MSGRDPLGKRALFGSPLAEVRGSADDRGHGFFTNTGKDTGSVVVECSGCSVKSRISVVDAAVAIGLCSAWVPGRRYSRWVTCPACDRRRWCRFRWFA